MGVWLTAKTLDHFIASVTESGQGVNAGKHAHALFGKLPFCLSFTPELLAQADHFFVLVVSVTVNQYDPRLAGIGFEYHDRIVDLRLLAFGFDLGGLRLGFVRPRLLALRLGFCFGLGDKLAFDFDRSAGFRFRLLDGFRLVVNVQIERNFVLRAFGWAWLHWLEPMTLC